MSGLTFGSANRADGLTDVGLSAVGLDKVTGSDEAVAMLGWRQRGGLLSFSVLAVALALIGLPAEGISTAAVTVSEAAPGGPGVLSHFDLARKDCLGTARNTRSKVWYTVAGGVLSDVYSPTIDNTNVETLQYVVTDGRTFTDLQSRDMTYTVRSTDESGMACQVTSTAKSGRYRLVSDYVTDPAGTRWSSPLGWSRPTALPRA